jgi:aminopeptidase N
MCAAQGAAVVGMFRFLLGPEGFQRGVETFFNHNDGKVSQPWSAEITPVWYHGCNQLRMSAALER